MRGKFIMIYLQIMISAGDEEGVREDTRVGLKEADRVVLADEIRGDLRVKQREEEMKKDGYMRFALKK